MSTSPPRTLGAAPVAPVRDTELSPLPMRRRRANRELGPVRVWVPLA